MIYVFEPHGDDALISCFPILKEGKSVHVVTFGSSRSSERLSVHYPWVTSEYHDLYEIPYSLVRVYFKEYSEWLKKAGTATAAGMSAWHWQLNKTVECGGELWKESYELLVPVMVSVLDRAYQGDEVYLPLGLMHGYHVAVSYAASRLSRMRPDVDFYYYSEAPYNQSLWVRSIEDSSPWTLKDTLQEISLSAEAHREKDEVFRDVYPEEAKKFVHNYPQVIKNSYRFYRGR